MHLYLNFAKLYIDLFKYMIRGDNDTNIFPDAGDTLVSLTLTRLSYLVAGCNFYLFCYYRLPAPTSSTKRLANI